MALISDSDRLTLRHDAYLMQEEAHTCLPGIGYPCCNARDSRPQAEER